MLGDGRVSLERELDEDGSMEFDILVLDAFSGDSVPVHLLTYEAFELYWQHLRTGGILAVNITNLHLDLSDVVRQLAKRFGKDALWFVDEGRRQYESHNVWVLVTDNAKFIESERVRDLRVEWIAPEPKPILWTDKFSNLFQVIRWQ